ncbi:hypothetical protein ACQKGO_21430 [Corallococcus interemptor]|uniref:hypothetical protein n=1 Tax=Corallococcus interemptor TaxID=2316720 RepID=UPI003D08CC30
MTRRGKGWLAHRAWALGLLLVVGLGAACDTKPGPPPVIEPPPDIDPPPGIDPPPPVPDDGMPRPQVLAEGARLLEVDARQRFMLFVRDGGTYAQDLPDGVPVRICGEAESVSVSDDGDKVLLWSPQGQDVSTRSFWLWRQGTPAAILLTSRLWGGWEFDPPMSYVAYSDFEGYGKASPMRIVRTAACTPEACPVWEPFPGIARASPYDAQSPQMLVRQDGHIVSLDVMSGALTDLGPSVMGPLRSADRAWYGLFDTENHLQVFDTATRTLQWEHVWRDEATRSKWHVSNAYFTSVGSVVLNIRSNADVVPPNQSDTVVCDAAGCRDTEGGTCQPASSDPEVLGCLIDLCPGLDCWVYEYSYLDAAGRTLVYLDRNASVTAGPIFSPAQDQVWMEGPSSGRILKWKDATETRQTAVEGYLDGSLFLLTPAPHQLVFTRALPDGRGGTDFRLSRWDGQTVSDVVRLGAPLAWARSSFKVRDNPRMLYMALGGEKGPFTTVRVPLP